VHFELDEVEGIMQSAMGLEPSSLRSGARFITWSRRIFCYIARTYGSHKGNDVAGHIGRDLATVTYNVRFVENLLRGGKKRKLKI
jgi:chromosomal replication initiation ATPase DnaA